MRVQRGSAAFGADSGKTASEVQYEMMRSAGCHGSLVHSATEDPRRASLMVCLYSVGSVFLVIIASLQVLLLCRSPVHGLVVMIWEPEVCGPWRML